MVIFLLIVEFVSYVTEKEGGSAPKTKSKIGKFD